MLARDFQKLKAGERLPLTAVAESARLLRLRRLGLFGATCSARSISSARCRFSVISQRLLAATRIRTVRSEVEIVSAQGRSRVGRTCGEEKAAVVYLAIDSGARQRKTTTANAVYGRARGALMQPTHRV
jgi:hypothetical protein